MGNILVQPDLTLSTQQLTRRVSICSMLSQRSYLGFSSSIWFWRKNSYQSLVLLHQKCATWNIPSYNHREEVHGKKGYVCSHFRKGPCLICIIFLWRSRWRSQKSVKNVEHLLWWVDSFHSLYENPPQSCSAWPQSGCHHLRAQGWLGGPEAGQLEDRLEVGPCWPEAGGLERC